MQMRQRDANEEEKAFVPTNRALSDYMDSRARGRRSSETSNVSKFERAVHTHPDRWEKTAGSYSDYTRRSPSSALAVSVSHPRYRGEVHDAATVSISTK